jgi:hypothetical protein
MSDEVPDIQPPDAEAMKEQVISRMAATFSDDLEVYKEVQNRTGQSMDRVMRWQMISQLMRYNSLIMEFLAQQQQRDRERIVRP